ncbi:hypothetical protein QO179_24855 [Bacillus stercoris]|nr:hypothetical protein [Bacillus stercoris]
MKYLANAADKTTTFNSKMASIATKPLDYAAKGTIAGAKKMVKDTKPGIANLWTGKRESGVGIAAAWTVAAGYGGYQTLKQTTLAPRTGEVSYGGTAPIMNAEGVGSTTQAPTLGANGNMVFGLHNARKG